MEKVLRCDCGFEAYATDEGGLAAEVRRHAWKAHGMPLSFEQALLLAFRAELDETWQLHRSPRDTAGRSEGASRRPPRGRPYEAKEK